MMNFKDEDLETFLIEAELINQKVKALAQNKMSTEQFDKLELTRAEDKRKRQQAIKRKEREAFQKKKRGRQGKGITKDFQNFCRFCHWQYEFPTPICLRCNKNTMTLEQRQQQLGVMVNQYKQKKKKRQQRKMKWDMWQKTKSMLWKKTSNSYEKWQYFISDSEQQKQQQPIVPKDDPNFKALQRDMQQRKAQRMKDTKKAKQLKQKGNAFMKEGNYEQAKNMYTLALQHIKDMKSIYTNRALAYIKLGKFKKAIKDCTNVIQYMEIFEKAEQNKDLIFKAHLRKALAEKQIKQYKQALQDVKKALTFCPNQKSAEMLKKQIQGFIEHTQKVQKILKQNKKNPQSQKKQSQKKQKQSQINQVAQDKQNLPTEQQSKQQQKDIIKQLAQQQSPEAQPQQKQHHHPQPQPESEPASPISLSPVQQIKQQVQNLSQQSISSLLKLLSNQPQLISIFIAAKGIPKCLNKLIAATECNREGVLVAICLNGDGVGEKEVWDFGVKGLYDRVIGILGGERIDIGLYFVLQDFFQVLIPMSLHQKYRELMSQSVDTFNFLEKAFALILTKHKKQPDLFSSFLIFMGNLCSGNSKLRDTFITQKKLQTIVNSLFEKVILKKTVNRSHLSLKKHIYNLFSNILRNQAHRTTFIQIMNQKYFEGENETTKWQYLIKQLRTYPKSAQNFQQYISSVLSIFTNATLGTNQHMEQLAQCLNERFLKNPAGYSYEILHRCLLTLPRIKYSNSTKLFKNMIKNISINLASIKKYQESRNLMESIVRLLNIIYIYANGNGEKFCQPLPENLLQEVKGYIGSLQFGENLFCNTCNFFGVILDAKTEYTHKMYLELKDSIKFLIEVAKDKVGNWRKSAAILLAKLSINNQCKQQLYKHHGMQVLKSIAQFVKQK